MVRCIHQHDARHPHRITPHGTGSRKAPCAVTDAKGIILRAYLSMKEMGREERLKPSHQHWLILQLETSGSVWLHNLRARQHRGNDFMKVPFANSSALSQLPVFLNSLAITDMAVPPIHAPFTPVHHSVPKPILPSTVCRGGCRLRIHLPTIRKQERRISTNERHHHHPLFRHSWDKILQLPTSTAGIVNAAPVLSVITSSSVSTARLNRRMIASTEHIARDGIIGLSVSATLADWKGTVGLPTRTEAQREALVRLVEDLRLVFPSLQQVIGHRHQSRP